MSVNLLCFPPTHSLALSPFSSPSLSLVLQLLGGEQRQASVHDEVVVLAAHLGQKLATLHHRVILTSEQLPLLLP